jgi:heme/copper-type cytochrome/quinol oxidase subunit 3
MSKMKETQEKQLRYMLILSIVFGIGFLGYSFIKNDETK